MANALAIAVGVTVPSSAHVTPSYGPQSRMEIPTDFEGDGVYVHLQTAGGRLLRLYTDTGGGSLLLSEFTAARLGLNPTPIVESELGSHAAQAKAPELGTAFPPLPVMAFVTPTTRQVASWPEQADGLVGATWFGRHIWTWDYPGHHLYLEGAGWRAPKHSQVVRLAFKTDAQGNRPSNFPRIVVRIDRQELPLLLDTGAETFLTSLAFTRLADEMPRLRAISMIAASVSDRWHVLHPSWRLIENAQEGTPASMIEVPNVLIGAISTGPVWFTRRPDANFHDFMTGSMDSRVEGALGGNALHHLVMTIDYASMEAAFGASK